MRLEYKLGEKEDIRASVTACPCSCTRSQVTVDQTDREKKQFCCPGKIVKEGGRRRTTRRTRRTRATGENSRTNGLGMVAYVHGHANRANVKLRERECFVSIKDGANARKYASRERQREQMNERLRE